MQQILEQELAFPHRTVRLVTMNWEEIEETPVYEGYRLSQRLSSNHEPLRIGNLETREVLSRVRSVGLLPPGHSIRMLPLGTPLRVVYCTFDEDFFERCTEIKRSIWERHIGTLVAIRNKRLEVLMQDIYGELMRPDFGYRRVIEAATDMILMELARHVRRLEQKRLPGGLTMALAPWQLRRIHERIEASLEIGYPNLSELATLCGISQGHLMRTFKASTGWQIQKYIAEERLNAAKRMLAEDQLSLKEIASALGFHNSGYFATTFRRMTGQTPSEYLNELRQKRAP